MKVIVYRQRENGTWPTVGMTDITLFTHYQTEPGAIRNGALPYANGRACRVEFYGDNVYNVEPRKTLYFDAHGRETTLAELPLPMADPYVYLQHGMYITVPAFGAWAASQGRPVITVFHFATSDLLYRNRQARKVFDSLSNAGLVGWVLTDNIAAFDRPALQAWFNDARKPVARSVMTTAVNILQHGVDLSDWPMLIAVGSDFATADLQALYEKVSCNPDRFRRAVLTD